MRAYNTFVLLAWSSLCCVVKAESEKVSLIDERNGFCDFVLYADDNGKYPLCYAGFCKDNNCVIQPHNVTWPCSELSPCEVEGTECFIDTYPYPDAPMNLGCGGSEAAKAFKKIRSQIDKKPRPEWWGLVHKYDEELGKYWKEREERELKEFDGLLSPFMEKRLRRSGNLPKGYDARKRRIQIEKEVREEKERVDKEAEERREREETEEKERKEREKKEREERERKTRAEQEKKEKAEQEKKEKAEQEKKMQEHEQKKVQESEKEKKIQAGKEAKQKTNEEKPKEAGEEGKEEKSEL
ncbi:hypothetical protein CKM354_000183900 [Cercospora kikuchii]|uniref:Uncharacterized protein n=1 Tax=Cercospora kikuchii TaxID=84275 RepID=A0A9P3CBQ0_9PEZI|nr:uncharacterized protein CKM354_000183900 [Cercospora kikuchii]GIZ38422.1 hypothetical protein CKM354_000183900 [Cercospora kikuchii]